VTQEQIERMVADLKARREERERARDEADERLEAANTELHERLVVRGEDSAELLESFNERQEESARLHRDAHEAALVDRDTGRRLAREAKNEAQRVTFMHAPRSIRPLIRRVRGATRQRRDGASRQRARAPDDDSGPSDEPPDVARRRAGPTSFPSGVPP
jgi:hypothetical protein